MTASGAARVVGVSIGTGQVWVRQAGAVRRGRARQAFFHSDEVRAVFWAAIAQGMSTGKASVVAGVGATTGRTWFREAGGMNALETVAGEPARTSGLDGGADLPAPRRAVIAPDPRPTPPAEPGAGAGVEPVSAEAGRATRPVLSFGERCLIEQLLDDGRIGGCSAIAMRLRRDRTTIWREMRRGTDPVTGRYAAVTGQLMADERRGRPKDRKLVPGTPLADLVEQWLLARHSPEQIQGRLVLEYPDDLEMRVSHETIYQYLYVQPRGGLRKEVATALCTGRIRRLVQGRTPQGRAGKRFKDGMINIAERPAEAEDRVVPGHWEGDLILGTANGSAIGTLVERTTGFVVLLHLAGDHTAATVADALIAKFPEIPEILRRSLTWDQGTEMADHKRITAATELDVYFCDPHSPWQRGTNENTNGLLRQYFPKGTDLSVHGPGILDNVAAELNARPRKRHGWRTPAEELNRLLSEASTAGVAPTT